MSWMAVCVLGSLRLNDGFNKKEKINTLIK